MSFLKQLPVGARVSWTPMNCEGWGGEDEFVDNGTVAPTMMEYLDWSQHEQIGTITVQEDNEVEIELERPLCGHTAVRYADKRGGDWSIVYAPWENLAPQNGLVHGTKKHVCVPNSLGVCISCGKVQA